MARIEEPPAVRDDGDHLTDADGTYSLLRERLAEFADRFAIDPVIEQALCPEADSMHVYPGMGDSIVASIARAKTDDIERFTEDYDMVFQNRFFLPESLSEISRLPRQQRRIIEYDRVRGVEPVESYRYAKTIHDGVVIKFIFDSESFGLSRNTAYSYTDSADSVHYLFEAGMRGDIPVADIPVFESYIQYAFSNVAVPQDISLRDLATRLRDMGVIDLSKERLDQRTTHGLALAQFTASVEFLSDIIALQQYGVNARQTRSLVALANKYRDALLADDYDSKVEMHSVLARSFHQAATRTLDKEHKEFLLTLSRRSLRTARSLTDNVEALKRVYQSLGYELPPALLTAETEQPAMMPRDTAVHAGKTVVKEEVQIDKEWLEEIYAESGRLQDEARLWWARWRLSARQRREHGYTPMQHQLVRGYRNLAGKLLLHSTEKEQAVLVIDVLHTLNSIVENQGDAAAMAVTEAFDIQHRLQRQVSQLQELAQEKDAQIPFPYIVPVDESYQHLRENWPAYRQLIIQYWPNYEGLAVVRRLGRLGFDPNETAQDNSSLQDRILKLTEIAEQLDRIILPPGAGKADVERELERIGAENPRINLKEWQRIVNLVGLTQDLGGSLFRSKEKTLGARVVYYVAVVQMGGDTYAIAEAPDIDNATFIVAEKHAAGNWLEVLEIDKTSVETVGAVRVVHSSKSRRSHIDRIYDKLISLHSTVPN